MMDGENPPDREKDERLSAYEARLIIWAGTDVLRMCEAAQAQSAEESSSSDAVQILHSWLDHIAKAFPRVVATLVEAEREACAKLAEDFAPLHGATLWEQATANRIANAIRARGETFDPKERIDEEKNR